MRDTLPLKKEKIIKNLDKYTETSDERDISSSMRVENLRRILEIFEG